MEGLVHLQKQNKRAIQDLFIFAFQHREKEIPETDLARLSESFKIKPEQAYEMCESIKFVIVESLYYNFNGDSLKQFLADAVDADTFKVISTIILYYLPEWKKQSLATQVSLPRVQEMDWRIDIQNASDNVEKMNTPTLIFNLKVEDVPTNVNIPPPSRNIQFELSKDSLEIVLEGLQQIKKQLDSIG